MANSKVSHLRYAEKVRDHGISASAGGVVIAWHRGAGLVGYDRLGAQSMVGYRGLVGRQGRCRLATTIGHD